MLTQPLPKGATVGARRADPRALARVLAEMPVQVDSVICRFGTINIASYPGGRRPTSVVAVSGRGETGYGELVAFTTDEQRAFAGRAAELLLDRGRSARLGHAIAATATAYERAALESALIDLALRQQRTSLHALCGIAAVPRICELRWVSSFGAVASPTQQLREIRAASQASEFKIDVDPQWSDRTIAELAGESGVVTFDFKEGGDADLARRLSSRFPGAIFEDPPPGTWHRLIARDRPLATGADVEAALARGELVNLKIPRMGGPLALLEAMGAAQNHGQAFYFGGMYGIGPGREQARQLAALFCGSAPNDLGPIPGAMAPPRPRSPSWVRLDTVGFGATSAWSQLLPSPL